MEKELDRPLWKAAASTFEHLGFLLAEPETSGVEVSELLPGVPGATVCFHGPVEGRVELWLDRSVADQVATTMLAVSPPLEDELLADTLGELSNVICGNLLPALLGPDAEFPLSPPEPWRSATPRAGDEGDRPPDAEVRLELGLGRALVRLYITAGSRAGSAAP